MTRTGNQKKQNRLEEKEKKRLLSESNQEETAQPEDNGIGEESEESNQKSQIVEDLNNSVNLKEEAKQEEGVDGSLLVGDMAESVIQKESPGAATTHITNAHGQADKENLKSESWELLTNSGLARAGATSQEGDTS